MKNGANNTKKQTTTTKLTNSKQQSHLSLNHSISLLHSSHAYQASGPDARSVAVQCVRRQTLSRGSDAACCGRSVAWSRARAVHTGHRNHATLSAQGTTSNRKHTKQDRKADTIKSKQRMKNRQKKNSPGTIGSPVDSVE
jgi:hypothetical protein